MTYFLEVKKRTNRVTQPLLRSVASRQARDDRSLMLHFQSLGNNVELGLVQRACEAEPLSLFRFTVCRIDSLCHAIETGLDHLFAGDDLEVYEDYGDGRFHCKSRYYNDFFYYVFLIDERLTIEEVTRRERRKIVFLRRKFLEDLKEGTRIFVRKGSDPLIDLRRLHTALRTHGPHPLLLVNVADADHPARSVKQLERDLFRGFLTRFAACNRNEPFDVEGWIELCRKTYELTQSGLSNPVIPRTVRETVAGWRRERSARSKLLNQVRRSCDGSPASLCFVADVLIANQAFVEADDLLSGALSVSPDHPALLKTYAMSAHSSGRFAPAIDRWNRALSSNPKDPMCFAGFAGNLREHGALERARDVIGSALAHFPDDMVVLSEAARIAEAAHRPADALALWDKVIALHGPHPEWNEGRERALALSAKRPGLVAHPEGFAV